MVEGGFPSARRALELLSFEDLARVNALAGRQVFRIRASPAGPVPEGLAEEVLLFDLAVSTARSTVTLSWPRADERGRPTLPSRLRGGGAPRRGGLHRRGSQEGRARG